MTNSINWGEIYKSSWWGDFPYNVKSFILKGVPDGFTDITFFNYKARVLADAGIFEAEQCAINEYNKIIAII